MMDRRSQRISVLAFVIATAGAAGCGGGGSSNAGSGGRGASGSGGNSAGGGSAATGGNSAGGHPATGGTGTGGAGGGSRFTTVAVCGQRGQATGNATTYDGWEEIFMTGEEGLGVDVCVVRYDVKRVGAAPAGCTDCTWTDQVEFSNPSVTTNTSGACANSDLGLTMAAINARVGTRVGIGYANMFQGAHGSARFIYFTDKMMWDVSGNATWDPTMNDLFKYDHRDGFCNYDPLAAQSPSR